MAKFNFNLRNPKFSDETPVHLIIRWYGNRIVYPTPLRINPKYWDSKKQYAKQMRSFPEYPEFNTMLDKLQSDAKDEFRKFQNDNNLALPTKREFKELLDIRFHKKNKEKENLIDFITLFMKQSKIRIGRAGKPISKGTIRIYMNVRDRLIEFQDLKSFKVDFDTIDLDFYYAFKEYLTVDMNYSTNTIGKYIRNLKTIMLEAVERGITDNLTFRSNKFIAGSEETVAIYLGEDELEDIFLLELSKMPKLENARDLFLVYCFTGLRYADVTTLKLSQVVCDEISLIMHKTQERVVVPFNHRIIKYIRNKYKGKTFNSLPRMISNSKLNLYIKEACSLVVSLQKDEEVSMTKGGMKSVLIKPKYQFVTVHTARRSFATNLMLDDVPVPQIMQVTGHKTERAFWKYIKVEPKDSIRAIKDLYSSK